MKLYFKEKNIKDEINVDEKQISIKKFKGDKVIYYSIFNTYWSKVFFKRVKNKSKLTIKESNKETEVASFLHSDLKENLFLRLKKQINFYS